jgi:hypothetical protein
MRRDGRLRASRQKLLKEDDCRHDWQGKGEDEIWYSPRTDRKFPVDSKIKSRHTATGILKQAGLPMPFDTWSPSAMTRKALTPQTTAARNWGRS